MMLLDDRPFTIDRIVRIGITAGLLWGLIWLLDYLSGVLVPFAVALLLAYLINPLVDRIEKKVPYRAVAVLISFFLLVFLTTALAWLIAPMISEEISHMGRVLSDFINNSDLAEKAARRLPPDLWNAVREYASSREVQEFFKTDNFWKIAGAVFKKLLPGAWGIITGTATLLSGMLGLSVIGLYLVFLLFDYRKIRDGWQELLPVSCRGAVVSFVQDFDTAMNRHFRAQAEVAAIVGVLFATGFSLVGLPLGILLGLFIGLLNMVPYLQILGLVPAIFLAFIHALETGHSFWVVTAMTGAVFVVVQIIQDAVLVPKIQGDVTGLSPAMILLSLSIWGKLLGFFGLIIALPMTCLVLAYYRRLLDMEELRIRASG